MENIAHFIPICCLRNQISDLRDPISNHDLGHGAKAEQIDRLISFHYKGRICEGL